MDELEHAFQAGADDALRRAYDTYGSLVFTFCSRTLGHAAAVDATQEVFISAWRSQARFDPEKGSLAAWLMTIAKRRCIDQLRHDGRRPQVTGADPELAAAAPTTAADTDIDAVERLADRMLVTEALEQLGGRSRQSVEMAFFEQLTHSEIATRTGQPIGTVKSDIRRGLARLRQFLEHQDA